MSSRDINRRKFLGISLSASALSLLPSTLFGKLATKSAKPIADIAVVRSSDFYLATQKAIEGIGGINQFVSKGSRVGLLINGVFSNAGTHTNPDIPLAVLKMCHDAGAKEIMLLKADKDNYWQEAKNYETHKELLKKATQTSGYTSIPIEKGVILKNAEVINEIKELDVLINLPITKHHAGATFTGCLKNMMGLCTRSTNRTFHNADGSHQTDGSRLSQCIADLNTVRLPDLHIFDATSFLISNGPGGPGEMLNENTVFAGTDPVAMDKYALKFFDFDEDQVQSIGFAQAHNLGENDLSKLNISELNLS